MITVSEVICRNSCLSKTLRNLFKTKRNSREMFKWKNAIKETDWRQEKCSPWLWLIHRGKSNGIVYLAERNLLTCRSAWIARKTYSTIIIYFTSYHLINVHFWTNFLYIITRHAVKLQTYIVKFKCNYWRNKIFSFKFNWYFPDLNSCEPNILYTKHYVVCAINIISE